MGLDPDQVAATAVADGVLPLASANGGFLFAKMDAMGMCCELHTLYRPEGWGREVHKAAKEAFAFVFRFRRVVITYEVAGNARSSPPKSFGFQCAGAWKDTPIGELRAWTLTQSAWEQSPANRRLKCP